ncbi:hypothetical protein AB0M43_06685 [Longispora sp. NPDC051575]|uniref:hypothetical protein n=1 Tax=Longispora sp. NPDC051575 TaxID=3154943 RepID=UPI00341E3A92
MTDHQPVLRPDAGHVRQLLLDARLDAVWYQQTPGSGLGAPPPDAATHEVDLDVVLRLSTGAVWLTWQRENLVEGLAVDPVAGPGTGTHWYDAGASRWAAAVGDTVSEVGLGWQVGEAGGPESLWAVRLGFAGGAEVLVAMGELDGEDRPGYFPESLLVLFDRAEARGYLPAGATAGAFPGE